MIDVLRASVFRLAAIALFGGVAWNASAQEVALPHLWITDGLVQSLALRGDTLFVGGDYEYVGPPTGQMAVLDKASGEADITQPRFGDGGSQSSVLAIELDGQGGYYVGGRFDFVSGETRHNLARVLPDGTLDPGFKPNPSGTVQALSFDANAPSPSGNGVLYIGGDFALVGGQVRRALAAVDAESGKLLPLSANFEYDHMTANPRVNTIAVYDDILYIGGTFDTVNDQERWSLAAFDRIDDQLTNWQPVLTAESPFTFPHVNHIAAAESTIYVGGIFDTVNGMPRDGVFEAMPLADGGGVTDWMSEHPFRRFVIAGDYLWSAGIFPSTGHIVGRVSRLTGQVQTFPITGDLRSGRSIAYDPWDGPSGEGTLYVVCSRSFGPGGTQQHPIVVAVDPATGQPTGYEVIGGGGRQDYRDARTIAVEPGPGGRVLVGGQQFSFGGVRRSGLVALDTETGRPVEGFDDTYPAQDLTLSPDGRYLYAMNAEIGFMLREFDLETGETRDLPTDAPSPGVTPRPPGPERILGGETALIATEDMLYGAAGGLFAIDRESGASVWQRSAATYFGRRNGQIVLVDGPGGPGGDDGTLYWAGPLAYFVNGPDIEAFAAARPRTGEILDWDVQAGGSSPQGRHLSWYDGGGSAPARLYLGGMGINGVPGASERRNYLAVDPMTAVDQGWDPSLQGPTGGLHVQNRPEGGAVVYTHRGAFDAHTAEPEGWNAGVAFTPAILSPRHGALFLGGGFNNSVQSSGHAHLVAVTPAVGFPPVSGEPGPDVESAALTAPYPNPARQRASLTLSLPEAGSVEVAVYDVLGRRVAVLYEGPLAAGEHALTVDTSGLAAGLYVVRAAGEGFWVSRRITMVR